MTLNDDGAALGGMTAAQTADDLTAAIYARTSSHSQQDGYSLDEQVRRCWSRCERLEWTVSHAFQDEAVSGADTEREQFQRLLHGAEQGWFDVVVVWKLDRFSRSLIHAVQVEADLRQWDVGLHSVTEHIDTTTPTGRFNFRNISSASELERDLIKQRSQMGLQAMAEQRKWPNATPPIGYSLRDDNTLVVNEPEAALVTHIFTRYLEVQSMPQLADELNERDDPECRSKEWTPYAVGKVLKNELYIGEYDVANVHAHVDEYQIIDNELFEEVTSVRRRFQRSTDPDRPEMDAGRKRRRVSRILDQYHEFVGE
mgnify:FL=1